MTEPMGEFREAIGRLRKRIEPAFSPDTAAAEYPIGRTPSTGHCAAVALIAHQMFGGDLVSAFVGGVSHWFNRIQIGNELLDIDLTADQFGKSPLVFGKAGTLYPETRLRSFVEVNNETLRRAQLLSCRAGLKDVAEQLKEHGYSAVRNGEGV